MPSVGGERHPCDRAKPRHLRRGKEARLRVNLEQSPRIHAGEVERFRSGHPNHKEEIYAGKTHRHV